jgi:integrase/recombinase XerD
MYEKIREYIEWKGTHAHRASINYKIWLQYFMNICGDKPLEEYNTTDIVKFHRWLEIHYSSCSVEYAMIILKNFFKYFKLRDYKCISPELIRLPKVKNKKSHRAVTEDEYNRIIAVIPTEEFNSLRDTLVIRLLWDTGIRVSELCDLNTEDIEETKTSAIIHTKKTGIKRAIVWSSETHHLLMKYMPARLAMENINRASALFVGKNTRAEWSMRITPRTIQRIIRHYALLAGIKVRVTPHSFRHGWAHKRRDNNAPLAFLQKGLGHINPASTFIYQKYDDKEFMNYARQHLIKPAA